MHAAILGSIVEQPVTERVLWRLDTPNRYRAEVLVQSQSHPSFDHIVEQAGYTRTPDGAPVTRALDNLLSMVQSGRQFSCRLRANPTHHVKTGRAEAGGARERGRRVGALAAPQQLEWFRKKLSAIGLPICVDEDEQLRAIIVGRQRLQFDKGTHRVTLQVATLDAVVEVTDPNSARDALLAGVGPGKAYGCGLLTLAPASAAV